MLFEDKKRKDGRSFEDHRDVDVRRGSKMQVGRRSSSIGCRSLIARRASLYIPANVTDPNKVSIEPYLTKSTTRGLDGPKIFGSGSDRPVLIQPQLTGLGINF